MSNVRISGGVIVNSKGEVVVVSQPGGSWSLPKGHVDAGEDELAAAIREIEEETGIVQPKLLRKIGTYERTRIGKHGGEDPEMRTITLFLFHSNQATLQPKDKDNPEAIWVPKEQVAAKLTHLKDKEFFESILATL